MLGRKSRSLQNELPLNASFNISSVERLGTGIYRVYFTQPFPNTYAVVANEISTSGPANYVCKSQNYTLNG